MQKLSRITSVGLLVLGFALAGCNSKLIDHVAVKASSNLESVRVSLVFDKSVHADFNGGFNISDYGVVFLKSFTSDQDPFEVGFDLRTAVMSDPGIVHLEPTLLLPNGLPIGLDIAMVQITKETPINPHYDIYGYVDVLKTSWLGTAAIFDYLNDKSFMEGLMVRQDFLRNAEGKPGIIGQIFGPQVNPDGSLLRPGGLALFANVRQLLGKVKPGKTQNFYAERIQIQKIDDYLAKEQ